MALQKTIQYKSLTIPDAYLKIDKIVYYKIDAYSETTVSSSYDVDGIESSVSKVIEYPAIYRLDISLTIKASKGGEVIDSKGYVMTLDIENKEGYIIQAYDYLKTLPEFSNAVDK